MRIVNLELDHLRGLGHKFVGLGKELAGTVIGNDSLQQAGEAQQARGTERLKALRKQAKAPAKEAKEAKAETFEHQEKAAQRAKSA